MTLFDDGIRVHLSSGDLEKIARTHVGIAGAGGLGSNCAVHLVRSGFCRLTIADFDTVDASNLNRQCYFMDQVGAKKTVALKENLMRINPSITVSTVDKKLEAKNALEVFKDCPVVVEALDDAADKAMMARVMAPSGKFFVSVSGIGGWGNSDRIRTRRVKDNFYIIGDMKSGVGEKVPPMSTIVAIAAAKQADVVLTHVIGPCKSAPYQGADC